MARSTNSLSYSVPYGAYEDNNGDTQYLILIEDPNDNLPKTFINGQKTFVAELQPDKISHVMAHKVDAEPILIENIKIVSNSSISPNYAKKSDVITLTFSSSKTLGALPTVKIDNNNVVPTQNGNDYTATWTVLEDDTQGITSFQITAESIDFTTTSGDGRCSRVEIDTVKPGISISDNATNFGIPFDFTITFDEIVTELSRDEVLITNGKLLKVLRVNKTKYRVTVVPRAVLCNIQIPTDSVFDMAGNGNELFNYNAVVNP